MCRTVYVPAEDGFYSSQLPNGSFNGLVSMLQHDKAHVTSCNIMMTSKRRAVVDYLTSLLEER